jgi:hypothetical protein
MAVMLFNDRHIWCNKKYNNMWFNLDSWSNGPKPIEFRSIFGRQKFGWIIVWNNIKSISNKQSFKSSSKVAPHLNADSINKDSATVIVNQPSKSPLEVTQHLNAVSTNEDSATVIVNQPSKSPSKRLSKRSSKHNRMEEDAVFDESFSIFERNESSQSNRFEILSSTEH